MYTLQACNVPNGTMYDPYGVLRRGAASRARVDAATDSAQAVFNSYLCRRPGDFVSFGLNVAKDVSDTNVSTACGAGIPPPGLPAAAGGNASVAAALAALLGTQPAKPPAPCCDITQGGVTVVPLNEGATSLPAVSAAPAQLIPKQGLLVPAGLSGRRDGRSRLPAMRGVGCATDLPQWGDAFPSGGPASALGNVLSWMQANPFATVVIAGGALYLLNAGGTRG